MKCVPLHVCVCVSYVAYSFVFQFWQRKHTRTHTFLYMHVYVREWQVSRKCSYCKRSEFLISFGKWNTYLAANEHKKTSEAHKVHTHKLLSNSPTDNITVTAVVRLFDQFARSFQLTEAVAMLCRSNSSYPPHTYIYVCIYVCVYFDPLCWQ